METNRKIELFDNLVSHTLECCSPSDVPDVLRGIGFTEKEIEEILYDWM